MLELFCMSILGVAYINALREEKRQEKIRNLKVAIFMYAVNHRILYNDVLEMIKNKAITIEEIEREGEN